jgi:ribulose-5-phosphate 4-epimerase/fuculose-1-phosphate aldolase
MAEITAFARGAGAQTVSAGEREARIALAACYRLIAHFGMDDLIYTHISARVPGEPRHFLINPYGMMFHEITASSLVKIDYDGNIVEDSAYPVNTAGFVIHSALHMERHDVNCVLHTHTRAGVAVSCLEEGLLHINQHSAMFYNRVAYHDYEGIALDLDERQRLVRDMGDKPALVLRNHGLLTAGRTVPEAFLLMYYLEQSCRIQLDLMAANAKPIRLSNNVLQHTAEQFTSSPTPCGDREWPALLRVLDAKDPSYRN